MGRGLNAALNILDIATRPYCSYCNQKCKKTWWEHDYYPSKKFCKKTCLNRFHKAELQMTDLGCSLCGNKNKSLNYYESNGKKYCKKTCLNKAHKILLQMADKGCSLCGKKNKSLRYYESEGKKYCSQKHHEIGVSDALILKINYL
mgnify:CR=1 FL=1